MTQHAVAAALIGPRFTFTDEYELQAGVADVLTTAGHQVVAEHRLGPRDRPDFLVDGNVAVEVKVAGSTANVARQLRRYATHPDVMTIVLVTARHAHRQIIDVGVPLHVVVVPVL